MRQARSTMIWIDARSRRDMAGARVQAEAAFEVVDASADVLRCRARTGGATPHVVAVEIDADAIDRVGAIRRAVLDALQEPASSAARPPRAPTTAPAIAYIEANLAGHVSLGSAARACRLSSCELSRRFHQEHRETFSAYVLRRRIERARALLEGGECAVSQVAYAVGFNDLSYFARVFRRIVGMRASEYQARHGTVVAPG